MCKSVNNGSIYPICRISRHSTIARAELVRRERDRGRSLPGYDGHGDLLGSLRKDQQPLKRQRKGDLGVRRHLGGRVAEDTLDCFEVGCGTLLVKRADQRGDGADAVRDLVLQLDGLRLCLLLAVSEFGGDLGEEGTEFFR